MIAGPNWPGVGPSLYQPASLRKFNAGVAMLPSASRPTP
jgi:hypothetical protein